ncbi:GNAT family N-acetyltransferase [Gymnodinialimonas hymeniacidonis]|uniref:GNAT family N-acetyltransferase n=1 Tax=Gymnodinialimonas hymeniacidonis TaxID=3126508 RepID=UPI0034C673B9
MTHAIREATGADLDPLAQVWHDAWHEAHAAHVPQELVDLRTLADFRARLPLMLPDLRTAGAPSAPLGLCVIRDDEMQQLFVAPAARGTGLAAALLHDAEARLAASGVTEAWLDVVIENARAIRFYQREGWRLGRRADMALDTTEGPGTFTLHVQIMTKPLHSAP